MTIKHILVVSAGEIELSDDEYRALYPAAVPYPFGRLQADPPGNPMEQFQRFPASAIHTAPPADPTGPENPA